MTQSLALTPLFGCSVPSGISPAGNVTTPVVSPDSVVDVFAVVFTGVVFGGSAAASEDAGAAGADVSGGGDVIFTLGGGDAVVGADVVGGRVVFGGWAGVVAGGTVGFIVVGDAVVGGTVGFSVGVGGVVVVGGSVGFSVVPPLPGRLELGFIFSMPFSM